MPLAIRKLEPQETTQAFPARGQMDVTEYTDALRVLGPGDTVAVALQDLSSRALKRRFTMAAKQLGYGITWSTQSGEGELYLRVVQVPVDGTTWRVNRKIRKKKT